MIYDLRLKFGEPSAREDAERKRRGWVKQGARQRRRQAPPVAARRHLLRQVPARRTRIPQVDSPAPHCRLLRSRLTTPYPFGAKAMLLAKLAYSRRQFSPLRAAHPRCPYALTAVVRVVHRT